MPIVIDVTVAGEVGDLYATVSDARARGITTAQVPVTSMLEQWLEEASREVDNYTNTRFNVSLPTTHTVADPRSSFVELPYPFSDITAVTVDGVAQTTHYAVGDYGIQFTYQPRGPVAVTGIFGYPTVPSPVRDATVLLVQANLEDGTYRPSVGTDLEGNASGLPLVGTVPFTSRTKRAVARDKLNPYRVLVGPA